MNSRMSVFTAPLMIAAVGFAGSAVASPVTYDYSGGAVDITGLTVNGTSVLPSGSTPAISLASTSTAVLDTTDDTISFTFSQGSPSPYGIALTGVLTGTGGAALNFNSATFSLGNLVLQSLNSSGASGSLQLVSGGGGNYSFTSGVDSGIAISGGWALAGASANGNALSKGNSAFGPTDKPISGTVALSTNADQLQIDGVPLGTFTISGQTVAVTGNILFDGAPPVPLPPAVWLLGSSVGLFALPALRRSRRR